MSDLITKAVEALNEKLGDADIGGSAKFIIEGEGGIVVDGDGARASDDDADVTFMAEADTYQQLFDGELNPTAAFMSGKLTIDGDMGLAMKLASSFG